MRLWVGAVSAALLLSGCASVTRGTTENISIATTPSGALANVAGTDAPFSCVTPCAVEVSRSADIVVSLSKAGYEPQVIPLTREISGGGGAGFAGNLLLGGVVGMGVDAATGAAMDHKPNPVVVTLQPVPAAPAVAAPAVRHRKPKVPVS
ncbi:translation initiation factor 2 [Rhodopseudomonas telluris]|uniref:Translation initiation factor 2 n=1 Tax=Rhodopseudomonas telluris TaxID=644215 RepID=A0ABV6EXD5_9BRAD